MTTSKEAPNPSEILSEKWDRLLRMIANQVMSVWISEQKCNINQDDSNNEQLHSNQFD